MWGIKISDSQDNYKYNNKNSIVANNLENQLNTNTHTDSDDLDIERLNFIKKLDIINSEKLKNIDISMLNSCITKEELEVKKKAIILASKIKDESTIIPLIACLNHFNPDIRLLALDSLFEYGELILDPLLQYDESTKDYFKFNKIELISRLGNTTHNTFLLAYLKDTNILIKIEAIQALANIGGPNSVEYLIKLLDDTNYMIRNVAAQSIGNLGNKNDIKHLEKLLKDESNLVRKTSSESIKIILNKSLENGFNNEPPSYNELPSIGSELNLNNSNNTKICSKCGEKKDLNDFYNNIRSKDSLSIYCKSCQKSYFKSNENNKEKSDNTTNNPLKLLRTIKR